NVIERLNREIRRRTRVVGSFPDGNSALMLVCARLRHVAGTQWGNKKYMNMKHLEDPLRTPPLPADFIYTRICKPICAKFLTLPKCSLKWMF
ncbi:MAG: transposase, partial [Candidatus Treponema excrementipullorum]|nr:transposase [Candidatus Treponema excrementipullorum]